MSALTDLLDTYRNAAVSEREKGTYFEELIVCYLKHEATYQDLYCHVWPYAAWAKLRGLSGQDTGIDLVAETSGTGEYHAIQCKLYAEDYKLQKADIDSFFTASGKKPFTHRLIVSTTHHWSEHAENALQGQSIPVSKIDLFDLENSQIDWTQYTPKASPVLKPKKSPFPHQRDAIAKTLAGLRNADRGKLIMACGTGKTFTSLKIAEAQAGPGQRVLFLVPSLALLAQTLTEWTQESATPLHSFAVCSDSDVGKKRQKDDDTVQTFAHELRYPATTDPARLAAAMARRHDLEHLTVVFGTYHSIDVIGAAQRDHGLPAFDLIICDEAHRTTGATFEGEDESHFVKVHDNGYIQGAKRLYMTATPRIFGTQAKARAESESVVLCSMDDPALYGHDLHVISFSEAVKGRLLVDYKVIVLAVEEAHVSRRLQSLLADVNNQLKVDDAAKIIGCWKALAKQGLDSSLTEDAHPMRRAVAFCQVIELQKGAKTHKVSSKHIAGMFQAVVEAYQDSEAADQPIPLRCEAAHVDGSMNASEKEAKLTWLKAETPGQTCRILSNVRCLSEGVDVPALDAVLFLTPRNSQVDVVQSVGRVMRNAPGKQRGYIILPVVIPAGVEPHVALNDNKTYKVVWEVLQALRSHDDRFDAMVNKLDLIGQDPSKMEVIAITDKIQPKPQPGRATDPANKGKGHYTIGNHVPPPPSVQEEIHFEIGDIERAIYAKLVQKCGNRHHWEDWANDIARIARTHIDRITGILENPAHTRERAAFQTFAAELRDDLNDSVTDAEIIEMLAQHLITQPVFAALFAGYAFAQHNPMSRAMQAVLDVLQEHRLDKEADTLEAFYASVKLRAEGIDHAAGKQKIIVELYDKFFRNAFPRMTARLGIVYTPVVVVDFILHSVNYLLQQEFGQTLGSKGVHILDPFTGTGTFITRLLQSGLIAPEQLPYKYQHEIHANEIVLLAYYIAAINIEAVYHSLIAPPSAGAEPGERAAYVPFQGICLTDTFQLYEKEDLISALLVDNSARRTRQKALDIRVIFGNPPYSAGQGSANDDAANIGYPYLDQRISQTYIGRSSGKGGKRAAYDSYIRAIRWASDRIGNSGVIGFVSGSGFVEKPAMDGLRKCLAEEFCNIHVLNLRGDIRKNMLSKGRAQEGQNIFGSGSMTGIAVTLFVKNPNAKRHGKIYYHDIGNDLTREEKLKKLSAYSSIAGLHEAGDWLSITPDTHGDWLAQRVDSFTKFLLIGTKKSAAREPLLFEAFSNGVVSNRDAWVYSYSKEQLTTQCIAMIDFYNSEVLRYQTHLHAGGHSQDVQEFVEKDTTRISWGGGNWQVKFAKGQREEFEPERLSLSLYRPFTKMWHYGGATFNHSFYSMPRIFPDGGAKNRVICVSGIGARSGFSAMMAEVMVNLHTLDTGQCFPLYVYETLQGSSGQSDFVAASGKSQNQRRDAITDAGLAHFQAAYPGATLTKEDLFYYVYGLLHSPDYRELFADNLAKELPRIPCVKTADDFWAFCQAGSALAALHLYYETVEPYPLDIKITGGPLTAADYRVEKMRYGKHGKDKDLTTLHYNARITLTGIPLAAYDYVINGKPALDWVVERQGVKTDKDSGIVNDANDWAIETMHNPRYPLELVQRVVTVSLETLKIVQSLPRLEI